MAVKFLPLSLSQQNRCPREDSNLEPTDYESAALTVELQGHKDLKGVTVRV